MSSCLKMSRRKTREPQKAVEEHRRQNSPPFGPLSTCRGIGGCVCSVFSFEPTAGPNRGFCLKNEVAHPPNPFFPFVDRCGNVLYLDRRVDLCISASVSFAPIPPKSPTATVTLGGHGCTRTALWPGAWELAPGCLHPEGLRTRGEITTTSCGNCLRPRPQAVSDVNTVCYCKEIWP